MLSALRVTMISWWVLRLAVGLFGKRETKLLLKKTQGANPLRGCFSCLISSDVVGGSSEGPKQREGEVWSVANVGDNNCFDVKPKAKEWGDGNLLRDCCFWCVTIVLFPVYGSASGRSGGVCLPIGMNRILFCGFCSETPLVCLLVSIFSVDSGRRFSPHTGHFDGKVFTGGFPLLVLPPLSFWCRSCILCCFRYCSGKGLKPVWKKKSSIPSVWVKEDPIFLV
jgi:hypothetical protein